MKNVYIVVSYSDLDKSFLGVKVNQEAFNTREEAIKFCKSKLSEEDNANIEKLKNRKLIEWYEFPSGLGHYSYEIEVLEMKEVK